MKNKIASYINGEMSAAEKLQFEQEMEQSAELRAEVAQMRALIGALTQKKLRQDIEAAELLLKGRKTSRLRWIIALGLVGVLLLLFIYFKYRSALSSAPTETPKTEDVTPITRPPAANQRPDSVPVASTPPVSPQKQIAQADPDKQNKQPRYRNLPADSGLPADGVDLADAFLPTFSPYPYLNMEGINVLWEEGKYQEYLNMIEDLNGKNRVDKPIPSIELVRAACFLHLHQPAQATRLLDPLLAEKEPLRAEAVWLLALCYVMEGKDESAEAALSGIRGKYAVQAKALLEKMR